MEESKNVCVVVLGDIGRSPRMQYHSKSLAEHGYKVDIVCYQETKPLNSLASETQVNFHYLPPYPNLSLPKTLNYILKTLWQIITLMFVLFIIRRPNIVLVQNPPAVPSVLVCLIFCGIIRAKYIIDWHNYAFTIMALNVGKEHILVKLTKKIEMFVGKRATYNFCVTKEMQRNLKDNWNICATILYDKPAEIFHPISIEEEHYLLKKLSQDYNEFRGENDKCTIMTNIEDGNFVLNMNRPGMIISSTSWTEDEDFSLLLKALQDYEKHKNNTGRNLPNLICIITGKGPLKEFYCQQIAQENWQHVKFVTPWLESEDYPKLLASADLGICLHTSSSGLDLPMKVVDMFGCGLPVCAYDFKCLNELIEHGKNGYTFCNAEELSEQLLDWFDNFPINEKQIKLNKKFKKELKSYQELRWKENWDLVAFNKFK